MENFDRKLPLTEGRRRGNPPPEGFNCKINNFMEKSKNTWGGARNYAKGSGVRVSLGCRVDPETMKALQELADKMGTSMGKVIDEIVKEYRSK